MGLINGSGKSGLPRQREYDRVSFLRRITVKIPTKDLFISASSIDINIKGLRFFSEKYFSAGEKIAVQVWLDSVSARDPLWISARVVWSNVERNGAITGIQFDELIKPDRHPNLYKMIYANPC